MNPKTEYDLIIIGAGPIGLACGIEATKAGLSYVILEKGCLVNSLFNYPLNMTFFSTSERLEIGDVPFISHGPKPNRVEALEYYRRVCLTWDLNVQLYEKVNAIVSRQTERHIIHSSKGTYHGTAVILALGFYDLPYLLNVPGEDLPKVKHYYDEPHPYFGQKIVVVGSSNSAVDVALETFRKGADVTMVIREPAIGESVKYWVKPDIENRIKEGSIKSFFNSVIVEIKEKEIEIKTPEGIINLENDFVFSMTGYHSDNKFLKSIGIELDENSNPVFNKETFETNLKGVYIAGVVCSGKNTDKYFIENSIEHSKIIINDIDKKI